MWLLKIHNTTKKNNKTLTYLRFVRIELIAQSIVIIPNLLEIPDSARHHIKLTTDKHLTDIIAQIPDLARSQIIQVGQRLIKVLAHLKIRA